MTKCFCRYLFMDRCFDVLSLALTRSEKSTVLEVCGLAFFIEGVGGE